MDRLLEATYQVEQRHFWFLGFRRFVRIFLNEAARGLEDPRLLDCGCGTGANLRILGSYGRAFGFDLTWTGLKFARGSPARVARATAAAVPFRDSCVDIATSFEVLYCLPEPDERAAVHEMWRVLKPGGAAVITVAALEMLEGDHSILSQELRRYTPHQLRGLLEEAGFRVERLTYTYLTTFPLIAGVRVLERLKRSRPEPEAITVPPTPINALLSGLLGLEALALAWVNMPMGSSLLCLARKPATSP